MNKGASIRAKLLTIAKSENLAFQVLIFRYLHERFLYRLSRSEFNNNFFLKGGTLLYAFEKELTRPTKDVDFLGKDINNDLEDIKFAFQKISTLTDNDAVWFDATTISAETIKEEDKYEGIRLFIVGGFDTIKQRIQIDVGFGDIIIPDAQIIDYPQLLAETNPVIIKAYSKESVIAEKFHAMVVLSYANSRMKDFYDVYALLKVNQFDTAVLTESIKTTFERRETSLNQLPSFFDDEFKTDVQLNKFWKQFLKKNKLNLIIEFHEVVRDIVKELKPIWDNLP
jgi:predicted nucleotidyltransferase component of viral defense system